jgi:iron complex outermembrane receptor protein
MLLLLSATAAAVLSDERAADAMSDQSIIVTGTRLPAGTLEVEERPGGANIVNSSEYKDKLAVSLKDALEFSPGV